MKYNLGGENGENYAHNNANFCGGIQIEPTEETHLFRRFSVQSEYPYWEDWEHVTTIEAMFLNDEILHDKAERLVTLIEQKSRRMQRKTHTILNRSLRKLINK